MSAERSDAAKWAPWIALALSVMAIVYQAGGIVNHQHEQDKRADTVEARADKAEAVQAVQGKQLSDHGAQLAGIDANVKFLVQREEQRHP